MEATQNTANDREPFGDKRQEMAADEEPLTVTSTAERLAARKEKERRKRRRLRSLIICGLLLAATAFGVWSLLGAGGRKKINLNVRPRSDQINEQSSNSASPDDITNQAIAETRSSLEKASQSGTSVQGSDKDSKPKHESSDNKASRTDGSNDLTAQEPIESTIAAPVTFRRNPEHSIRFSPPEPPAASAPTVRTADTKADQARTAKSSTSVAPQPSLPAYGSLLPVRSLGAIFTMRSGTARLELSRDVRGDGWSLSRGTVLVCNLNGSERDRALLTLVGFIDPERNQLVRVSGEVLGSDGGAGLKGKQHKLSSAWSRAFSKIGSTAINVAGAIAAGRISGQPVIVTDIGSRAINPVTREVDDLVLDRSDGRSFVEVPAQSPGYILVTQLPPTNSRARETERQITQADGPLSDEELAEILTSNDRSRIQAALPRMTPEMRKLAEAMLQEN